jgi:hypothetical protein
MSHKGRQASVNCTADGRLLGLALFLNERELRNLGIDPEKTDSVAYAVENGEIRLSKPDREVDVE